MSDDTARDTRPQVFFMLVSAAIFGYFGWMTVWAQQLLPMTAILKWSLRIGSIAFAVAAGLAFAGGMLGPLLYAVAGVVTSILFVVVAVMDWANATHSTGIPPFLLLLFAAWNGYGSVAAIAEVRAGRRPDAG
jgi:hypothetical protein